MFELSFLYYFLIHTIHISATRVNPRPTWPVVSFAADFRDVTQRSHERRLRRRLQSLLSHFDSTSISLVMRNKTMKVSPRDKNSKLNANLWKNPKHNANPHVTINYNTLKLHWTPYNVYQNLHLVMFSQEKLIFHLLHITRQKQIPFWVLLIFGRRRLALVIIAQGCRMSWPSIDLTRRNVGSD